MDYSMGILYYQSTYSMEILTRGECVFDRNLIDAFGHPSVGFFHLLHVKQQRNLCLSFKRFLSSSF